MLRHRCAKVNPSKRYIQKTKHRIQLVLMRVKKYAKSLNSVFVSKGISMGLNEDEDCDYYSFHNVYLRFKHPYVEKTYKVHMNQKLFRYITLMVRFLIVIGIIYNLIKIFMNLDDENVIIAYSLLTFISANFLVFTYKKLFKAQFDRFVIIFVTLFLLFKFTEETVNNFDASLSTALVLTGNFFFFNVSNYKMFVINLFFLVVYLIETGIIYAIRESAKNVLIIMFNYSTLAIGIFLISA